MSKKSDTGYDPALTQLFASSVGPAHTSQTIISSIPSQRVPRRGKKAEHDHIANGGTAAESSPVNDPAQDERQPRKRKRKTDDEDDIESRYMRRLAPQEANEQNHRTAIKSGLEPGEGINHEKPQEVSVIDPDRVFKTVPVGASENPDAEDDEPPRHETIAPDHKDTDVEKASKTVFLANISTSTITSKTAKKALMSHLSSFFPSLTQSNIPHAIESFRFRSTAFAESGMPRKAAFIRQELMDTTTKNTNAYAVYTTQLAAREAVKRLNGTTILERHVRVDSVAHPAKQDHRRSVFIGNLSFVDDTTNIDAAKDVDSNSKPRKGKDPADVEEGLWRQFEKAGRVESVRVVRDKTTRVGKGFAYVQFSDANAVEKALSFNGKKFPPMLPRILRVTRAKSVTKSKLPDDRSRRFDTKPGFKRIAKKRSPESSKESKSLGGRANKLLGRAGAAQADERQMTKTRRPTKNSNRRAESFKKKARQK